VEREDNKYKKNNFMGFRLIIVLVVFVVFLFCFVRVHVENVESVEFVKIE